MGCATLLKRLGYVLRQSCRYWNLFVYYCLQATPLIAGLAVAATALAGRYGIQAWQAYKARPIVPRMRKFYEGGFQPMMNRREAALILGVRYTIHTTYIIYVPWSIIVYVAIYVRLP